MGWEAGAILVRLHKRTPIRPSTAAPRNAPTTPPTSATLLLLLPLPFPVPLVIVVGESPNVEVESLSLCTLATLSSLSNDLERTLAALSNDDTLAEALANDRERSASTD